MGKGLMLGILDGLGDMLGSLFSKLFMFFGEKILVPIVSAFISVVLTVIQYVIAIYMYQLSRFLMILIDIVEALFRALAGLDGGAGSISLSLGGKQGDLLIQFLTSKEVMQVFYATAIVGVFLLIITTIFQMIKVEYTTEGAQNSKSGIIGKSLKSLTNMLIIPVLCVFGVFVGNQILDLIDTATKGADNAKISGVLWTTAASSAMLREENKTDFIYLGLISPDLFKNFAVVAGITSGFAEVFGDAQGDPIFGLCVDAEHPNPNADQIENNFMKCTEGYQYYNIANAAKYYNIFQVNYLLLIAAACVIIKCLYSVCFGMIDRLYQCTALFIIMPMVVGMSPVKDSLGSWRGKFMSKALSAYGVVISMNLFFIIVKIMLNIDIKVGAGGLSSLSSSMVEGIIKLMMVMGGVSMIEKLSKDMAGYFGGGDALGDGKAWKDSATKGLKDTAAFAVKTGMAVATGGASLVALGKSAASGIADKIQTHNETKTNLGALNSANAGLTKATGEQENANNALLAAQGVSQGLGQKWNDARAERTSALKDYRAKQNVVDNLKASGASADEIAKAQKEADTANYVYQDAQKRVNLVHSDYMNSVDATNAAQVAKDAADKNVATAQANKDKAQSAVDADKEKAAKRAEEKAERKEERKAEFMRKAEGMTRYMGDKFGVKSSLKKYAPTLSGFMDDYDKAYTAANSVSDEGKQILENKKKAKADAEKDAYEKRNKGWIEPRQIKAMSLSLDAVNAGLERSNKENTDQLEKLYKLLKKLGDQYKAAGSDEALKTSIAQRAVAVQQQMEGINSKIEFDGAFEVRNPDTALKVDLKMDEDFKKTIAEQIKKGVKLDDIMAQISEEFKRMGIEDQKTLDQIYKELTDLKGKLG